LARETEKYSEETCPRSTLSTTNPTCLDQGLNPGRLGGKPATNRLSYGAAHPYALLCHYALCGRVEQSRDFLGCTPAVSKAARHAM
jgi:hypothetical protein